MRTGRHEGPDGGEGSPRAGAARLLQPVLQEQRELRAHVHPHRAHRRGGDRLQVRLQDRLQTHQVGVTIWVVMSYIYLDGVLHRWNVAAHWW